MEAEIWLRLMAAGCDAVFIARLLDELYLRRGGLVGDGSWFMELAQDWGYDPHYILRILGPATEMRPAA